MTSSPEMLSGAGSVDQSRSPILEKVFGPQPTAEQVALDTRFRLAQLGAFTAANDAAPMQQESAEAIPSALQAQVGVLEQSQRDAVFAILHWNSLASNDSDLLPVAA